MHRKPSAAQLCRRDTELLCQTVLLLDVCHFHHKCCVWQTWHACFDSDFWPAGLPTDTLIKPPLPVPAPPAFTIVAANAIQSDEEEGQAESAGTDLALHSQALGIEAQSAEAAQKALPSDDDDFSDEVQPANPIILLLAHKQTLVTLCQIRQHTLGS